MSDIDLAYVEDNVHRHVTTRKLIEAAATVANALSVGLGPCIAGTLMEQELRDALCLKPGELVNIPKQGTRGEEHG